jgi:hypothetical protein
VQLDLPLTADDLLGDDWWLRQLSAVEQAALDRAEAEWFDRASDESYFRSGRNGR